MSHKTYVRDLVAITAAGAIVLTGIAAAGPTVVAVAALIVAPFAIILTLLVRELVRALDATDEYCSVVDQELDARRQLRVIRTVVAEPQPAPVVDLFTREPVA